MSVELQIPFLSLLNIVKGNIQFYLDNSCIPPFRITPLDDLTYIDHINAVQATITQFNSGMLQFLVEPDIFTVTEGSLVDNSDPPGALTPNPLLAPKITFALTLTGTTLSLGVVPVDPPQIGDIINNDNLKIPPIDLAPALAALGIPSVTSSRLEQAGGYLAVRFNPGPSTGTVYVQFGQQWAVFIDAANIIRLVNTLLRQKVVDNLRLCNVALLCEHIL